MFISNNIIKKSILQERNHANIFEKAEANLFREGLMKIFKNAPRPKKPSSLKKNPKEVKYFNLNIYKYVSDDYFNKTILNTQKTPKQNLFNVTTTLSSIINKRERLLKRQSSKYESRNMNSYSRNHECYTIEC